MSDFILFTRGSAVMVSPSLEDPAAVTVYQARSIESADKALAHLETAMSPAQRQGIFNHLRGSELIREAWAANTNAALYPGAAMEEQS